MKKINSFFPINTATACQLKWTWSTIFLNDGTTASCHRTGRHKIELDDFDNFHNTDLKLQQRKAMLNGEWPKAPDGMHEDKGCSYCRKIEQSGGQSDRINHLQIPGLVPDELKENPLATVVTPKILEIFTNNTCNLACTYCFYGNSSVIEKENIKYGDFLKNGVNLPAKKVDRELNQKYTEAWFKWMGKNYHTLKRLHLLGGEPLYQKEFYQLIDFFNRHPNKELELNIVTNLMIPNGKLEKLLDQIYSMLKTKKIKRFDVTVSLDCWGQEQEYARYGIDLDLMEKNMASLLSKKWIYLNINSTLSPLTIKSLLQLIHKIKTWKKDRKLFHHMQTVFDPIYHNPDIFGGDFWKDDLNKCLDAMPVNDWHEYNQKNYFKGICKQILSSKIKPDLIAQFHTHLDELDRRRGTDWRNIFPYLNIDL